MSAALDRTAAALLALPLASAWSGCQGGLPAEGAERGEDPARAAAADDAPEEFGDVSFGRDLDAALARARRTETPVLLLFQEVPG